MNFKQAVTSAFNNYAVFTGRSRRSEYWFFSLFNMIVLITLWAIGFIIAVLLQNYAIMSATYVILGGYVIAIIVPGLSVACRRLHDIRRSGAFLLIELVPIFGGIILMIWAMKDGEPNRNAYGPDPKNRDTTPEMFGFGEAPVIITPPPSEVPLYEDKKRCPKCKFDNDLKASYCAKCGTKLEALKPSGSRLRECPTCHKKIEYAANFCPLCGQRIEISESTDSDNDLHPHGLFAPDDLG